MQDLYRVAYAAHRRKNIYRQGFWPGARIFLVHAGLPLPGTAGTEAAFIHKEHESLVIARPEHFPLHFEQLPAHFPAPGYAILGAVHFFGDVENNGLVIFAEESAAFFNRRNLGRAGALLAVTGAAKSTFKPHPVGNFNLGRINPVVIFKIIALEYFFQLAVFRNGNLLLYRYFI